MGFKHLYIILFLLFTLAAGAYAQQKDVNQCQCNPMPVEARKWVKGKPNQPWVSYSTCVIDSICGFTSTGGVEVNKYGSPLSKKVKATGFFHTQFIDGRWWIVDPDGYCNIQRVVNGVRQGGSENSKNSFNKKYDGSSQRWMESTANDFSELGFTGTGCWSEDSVVVKYNVDNSNKLSHCRTLNFMSSYGKQRGGTYQLAGNIGYPNQCIFIFDPEFERFCDEHAKQVILDNNDSNLLGYFSDNELPIGLKNLDGYLNLSNKQDPGYLAAKSYIDSLGIMQKDVTDRHRSEFAGRVAERYYRIVSQALRKYAPNHMYLGSRLHAGAKNVEQILNAAGRYCDIVSINYYGVWTPRSQDLDNWSRWSGKPYMITEFYTKAMDSGLANTTGAGYTVHTQKDRGYAYQDFCLALLKSPNCVGWHFFKYQDNDPEEKGADPSNIDSNKGIVDKNYNFYTDMTKLMMQLNTNVYQLIDFWGKKDKELDIILAIGQSNMAGRGPLGGDTLALNNVMLLNNEGIFIQASNPMNKYSNIRKNIKLQRISPSYTCALDLVEYLQKPIGFVVNAQGGSSINLWYEPGRANYDATIKRAKEAQKFGKIKAIIWHQGSSDNSDGLKDSFISYKIKLAAMVENLRRDLNEPELFIIIGELSERSDFIDFNREVVQKVSEYIPYSDYIKTSDTKLMEDGIHFDAPSTNLLGKRYAEKIIEKVYRKQISD